MLNNLTKSLLTEAQSHDAAVVVYESWYDLEAALRDCLEGLQVGKDVPNTVVSRELALEDVERMLNEGVLPLLAVLKGQIRVLKPLVKNSEVTLAGAFQEGFD